MFPTKANEQFTDSQKHALDCQRNLALRANAGSGKTSVLVDRMIQILKHHMRKAGDDLFHNHGITLRNIVSITFTRKAAAELKQRLRILLAEQISKARENEWEREWWNARLEELEVAEIGTIDGFLGAILREYALVDESEYPVEPDFRMLEPFEAEQIREQAIQAVLAMDETDHQELKAALQWWKRLDGPRSLQGHLTRLLDHSAGVNKILQVNKVVNPEEEVKVMEDQLPASQKMVHERESLRDTLATIVTKIKAESKVTATLKDCENESQEILSLLDEPQKRLEVFEKLFDLLLDSKGKVRSLGRHGLVKSEMEALQLGWREVLNESKFDADLEIRALHARNHLMVILRRVHDEYMRLCHARNTFDFDTVARRVLWLFETYPNVPQELKKRFRFIQIDEFQDTSKLQWEILSHLVANGPDTKLEEDRLFVVGDPQQSIYGFRQADVSVFHDVQKLIIESNRDHGHGELPTHYENASQVEAEEKVRLGEMRLSENFRTLEHTPLSFFNKLFKYVFDPISHNYDPNESFQVKFQELVAGLKVEGRGETIYLEAAESQEEDESDPHSEQETSEDIGVNQVRMIADELIRHYGLPRQKPDRNGGCQTFSWKDMAILIPSRNKILRNLEEHLRTRGIPYAVHGGVGFWQRQEIVDMMHLCLCLSQPGNDVALLGVLRGPAIACKDADLMFFHYLGGRRLPRGLSILQSLDADLEKACEKGKLHKLPPQDLKNLKSAWKQFSQEDKSRLVNASTKVGLQGEWRRLADRMSHTDLLQMCLEESGAYQRYASQHDGEQVIANLGQFFEFLRLEESKPGSSLARVANGLQQRAEESIKDSQAAVEVEGMNAVQIMTVHASKGLQFPLVVVPNLQRPVSGKSAESVMVDSNGFVGLRIRHPLLPRTEEANWAHKKAAKEKKAREMAESRRLFYVAATRAEEVLILSAQKPRSNGESWRKWFYSALGLQDSHFKAGVWEEKGLQIHLRSHPDAHVAPVLAKNDDSDWQLDMKAYSENSMCSPMAVTRLEEQTEEFSDAPARWHLKTSYHVQPNYHIPQPSQIGSARKSESSRQIGATIGTAVHRALERYAEWIDLAENDQRKWIDCLVDAELALAAREMDLEDEALILDAGQIKSIKAKVSNLLKYAQSEEVQQILRSPGMVEQDFLLPLEGWLVQGRIDKWVMLEDGTIEIVDWKTDAGPADQSISKHQFQMQLYALAMENCGKLPKKQALIKVRLVLLDHEKIHDYEFSMDTLREFGAGLKAKLSAMKKLAGHPLNDEELAQLAV